MEQKIVYAMTEQEQDMGETVPQITYKIFLNSFL